LGCPRFSSCGHQSRRIPARSREHRTQHQSMAQPNRDPKPQRCLVAEGQTAVSAKAEFAWTSIAALNRRALRHWEGEPEHRGLERRHFGLEADGCRRGSAAVPEVGMYKMM
jgi:hypothetical protein